MTKYNPTIRMAQEPYDIIKWFTFNWDNEVGALGIGEMRDGELCVDKLVFPKQIVNGVHVHFKPEDWGPVVQELSEEDLSKIIFYWHKHPPGSASASQGDEDDTFDVFMDENSGREFFGFLITSKKDTEMLYTARIEMRTPVWASLEDAHLVTDRDDAIAGVCEQIIKDKITVGSASASQQPGASHEVQTKIVNTGSYGNNYYDYNDCVLTVARKNGQIIIEASDYFDTWISEMLDIDYAEDIQDTKAIQANDGLIQYTIQPKKKKIKKLYNLLKAHQVDIEAYEEEEDDFNDERMATTRRNPNYVEDYDFYGPYNNRWGY